MAQKRNTRGHIGILLFGVLLLTIPTVTSAQNSTDTTQTDNTNSTKGGVPNNFVNLISILNSLQSPVPQFVMGTIPAILVAAACPYESLGQKILWLLYVLGAPLAAIQYYLMLGKNRRNLVMHWLPREYFVSDVETENVTTAAGKHMAYRPLGVHGQRCVLTFEDEKWVEEVTSGRRRSDSDDEDDERQHADTSGATSSASHNRLISSPPTPTEMQSTRYSGGMSLELLRSPDRRLTAEPDQILVHRSSSTSTLASSQPPTPNNTSRISLPISTTPTDPPPALTSPPHTATPTSPPLSPLSPSIPLLHLPPSDRPRRWPSNLATPPHLYSCTSFSTLVDQFSSVLALYYIVLGYTSGVARLAGLCSMEGWPYIPMLYAWCLFIIFGRFRKGVTVVRDPRKVLGIRKVRVSRFPSKSRDDTVMYVWITYVLAVALPWLSVVFGYFTKPVSYGCRSQYLSFVCGLWTVGNTLHLSVMLRKSPMMYGTNADRFAVMAVGVGIVVSSVFLSILSPRNEMWVALFGDKCDISKACPDPVSFGGA
ncbi:hypothetical protein HDV00_003414 [Rhizophlyctis rosea]|nr:hypothetical protein HDV00_003414 [Rhizophlyctis rosea]